MHARVSNCISMQIVSENRRVLQLAAHSGNNNWCFGLFIEQHNVTATQNIFQPNMDMCVYHSMMSGARIIQFVCGHFSFLPIVSRTHSVLAE